MSRLDPMTTTAPTTAGRLGRITGTVVRGAITINRQIDWAEVGQIVWHGLIALAVAIYVAGEFTGRALHRCNDQLARLWVQLWVREAAAPAVAPVITTAAPLAQPAAAPAVHPLLIVSGELEQLTASQLRALLGTRKRCSRAQLINMALAC
jgi:hypothetical protein